MKMNRKKFPAIVFIMLIVNTVCGQLILNSPNGGETWSAGSTQNISWSTGGGPTATPYRLDYSTDSGATWISITSNAGVSPYAWFVPNVSSVKCLVRISTGSSGTSTFDISNSVFTISGGTTFVEQEGLQKNAVSVYPNPAVVSEPIIITSEVGVLDILVYNMLGEIVATKQMERGDFNNVKFSLHNFLPGIYLFNVKTSKGASWTKVTVVNH